MSTTRETRISKDRETRISKEIEQMFKTANIVSINNIEPKSIDLNDKNLMDITIRSIMEYIKMPRRVIDDPYVLTVVCRQIDRSHIEKNVTYIFIIPEEYPFKEPIIKTDIPSVTYNGFGLPQVSISSENDIDRLINNTVYHVAGMSWSPSNALIDIIKGSQTRELDPTIVKSKFTFDIEKPKGGRRKTRRRKNKRSKKNKKGKYLKFIK